MKPTSAPASLVPPRPNLGPEPLADDGTGRLAWMGIAAAAILGVLLLARIARRRRRRTRPVADRSPSEPILEAEAEGIVALAEAARAGLVARFGPSWRARTTEEIAADAGLIEALGPEAVARLAALLGAADLAKFAAVPVEIQREDADWVAAFVAAGASSTIKGK